MSFLRNRKVQKKMEENQIIEAIKRARKGIGQYLAIMELFPIVDVSTDCDFQRQFNAFYRIRQRPREWYEQYYSYMERNKKADILFEQVLDYLFETLRRYEPSFSSKLAATINPNQPVWDSFVLQNTGQRPPSYAANNRIERAKEVFQNIRQWYENQMQSEEGQLIIATFNRLVEEHEQITDLKKIDFVLWQTRPRNPLQRLDRE